jgi:hypothetical protein
MKASLDLKDIVSKAVLTLALCFGGSSVRAQSRDVLDRWPWSWGSECPFPWESAKGEFFVGQGAMASTYSGHRLAISISADRRSEGMKVSVIHKDPRQRVLGQGQVMTPDSRQRVVDVEMVSPSGDHYRVLIRAYLSAVTSSSRAAPAAQACYRKRKVLAVSFCPMRGTRCLSEQNYVLGALD